MLANKNMLANTTASPARVDLVGDDELRLIGSFLANPNDRRNLALTSHDAYRLFARA